MDHHIQKAIISKLMRSERLRFSELQPEGVENKLFDYHLKAVLRSGLVVKQDEGYALSAEGRRLWRRMSESDDWFANLAHSVLFLVIRRQADGAWLLLKRSAHPLLGKVGFLHSIPQPDTQVCDSATADLRDRFGLTCEFSRLGGGFLRITEGDELQSFTHFELLVWVD